LSGKAEEKETFGKLEKSVVDIKTKLKNSLECKAVRVYWVCVAQDRAVRRQSLVRMVTNLQVYI
jgi:hypothetical protein